MGNSSTLSKPCLLLLVTLQSSLLYALTDLGAEENLFNIDLAKQLTLLLILLGPPMPATTLNSLVFVHITHQAKPVRLISSKNHWDTISFFIFPSLDTPLILNYPWLEKHNLHINWAGNKIRIWSLFRLAKCLQSAWTTGSQSPPPPLAQPRHLSSVPEEYHDFQEVFTKDISLPLHRTYDCAIDLLSRAPLPSCHLYNLSWPERGAVEKHICGSLAARIICPSSRCRFLFCGQNR